MASGKRLAKARGKGYSGRTTICGGMKRRDRATGNEKGRCFEHMRRPPKKRRDGIGAF